MTISLRLVPGKETPKVKSGETILCGYGLPSVGSAERA